MGFFLYMSAEIRDESGLYVQQINPIQANAIDNKATEWESM